MQKIVVAFLTAILIAVLFVSPAAAGAPSSVQASGTCGDTYTVQPGDWLSKIASYCGTTVGDIWSRNAFIFNANLIYAGWVLSLTGPVVRPPTPYYGYIYYGYGGYNPYYPPPPTYYPTPMPPSYNTGYASVSLSTTYTVIGGSVTVYVHGFPANTEIDYRLGLQGQAASVLYDGRTDAYGNASAVVTIPSSAAVGQYWTVLVITTSGTKGVQIVSPPIYISG